MCFQCKSCSVFAHSIVFGEETFYLRVTGTFVVFVQRSLSSFNYMSRILSNFKLLTAFTSVYPWF